MPLKDKAGNIVTDADILLENAVIQVKGGGGKGLTSQVMTKTPKGTDQHQEKGYQNKRKAVL